MTKAIPLKIGVIDFETDPFRPGHKIEPFCWGALYEDGTYYSGWGDDAVDTLASHLRENEKCIVYAHNGGKFDFLFLAQHLEPEILAMDGRISRARINNTELRDSYLILPQKINEIGMKIGIDYKIFARGQRERHRRRIMDYMREDCEILLRQVLIFRQRFGNALTAAQAGTRLLNKQHREYYGRAVGRLSLEADKFFRQFYFHGRNECFEHGVIKDNWKMFDVRSMFPACMRDYLHPTGTEYIKSRELDEHTDFVIFDGHSHGALPVRQADGSIIFPNGRGQFKVTGYELRAALAQKLVSIDRIEACFEFIRRENFAGFVTGVSDMRMVALSEQKHADAQNLKTVLVATYGKQAFNIHDMKETMVLPPLHLIDEAKVEELREDGWQPAVPTESVSFWQRDCTNMIKKRSVRHVALAASVTGAARARIHEALAVCDRPVYVDTDGIICRELHMPHVDEVGGWRMIDRGIELAISGKKSYCLWDEIGPRRWVSKPGDLTPEQIRALATGESVKWEAKRPTFSIYTMGSYMRREYRKTAN